MDFLRPSEFIKQLPLQSGMAVADFGAGQGHFAVQLARVVGETGTVYAVDIQPRMVSKVQREAKRAGLHNVHTETGDLEQMGGSGIADNALHGVVIANVLFQADDGGAILQEAARVVRSGGWCAVTDWETHRGAEGSFGPHQTHVVPVDQVKKWAESAGFMFRRSLPAGENHYGLLFQKP